ncbi:MAG: hypothetical protein JRC91_06330 [Deltaproteobacteria bacterium]|nr:hypothetical protein [Deltaproteobacteria bacterium]
MKLTKSETIRECEKAFIDTINEGLDREALEKILFEKYNFTLQEDIDYKKGDLMVYNDTIAYKFDFEIKVPLSVIFNRQGECLEISTERDNPEEEGEDDLFGEENTLAPPISSEPDGKVAQMASNIADMISDINQPETEHEDE